MEGFIDIHSHILPQLDDGSKNMEQTLRMLTIAYEEGIRTIIATPHYHQERKMTAMDEIPDRIRRVQEVIHEHLPQMKLESGCEINYSQDCIELLKNKQIPTLAGSRYVLVEFSPMVEFRYMKHALSDLLMAGYSPVVAHVERYELVAKKVDQVFELIDAGSYIQVNAMSVMGEFGRGKKGIAKRLLKNNGVHFIGTDAHSDENRAPRMQACAAYIAKKYGQDYMEELFIKNPGNILLNQYL